MLSHIKYKISSTVKKSWDKLTEMRWHDVRTQKMNIR